MAARRSACSGRLRQVLTAAEQEAERLKDEYTSTEHLFVAIAAEGGRSSAIPAPPAARHHERHDPAGDDERARVAARHQPESGVDVSGARALRARPHRARPQGQARSGHRPRRRNPAGHSGAVPAHQEQSRAHRRARGRQDRRRRRTGAADRPAGRPGGPQEQEDRRSRHGRARRRGEVSRRVRGAAEGGPQGSGGRRRSGDSLHRRAAHRRRCRRRRGRDGRVEHAQADAGARRAPHRRRHDARRVSQAHREGCRPRTPLPARRRERAERRGHDQHPARVARALRGPPRRQVQGPAPWWPPPCCRIATSRTGSCRTRPST